MVIWYVVHCACKNVALSCMKGKEKNRKQVQCVSVDGNSTTPMMTTEMKINIGTDLICLQKLLFVYWILNTFTTTTAMVCTWQGSQKIAGHMYYIKLYCVYTNTYSYIFLGGQIILKAVFVFAIADVVCYGVVWYDGGGAHRHRRHRKRRRRRRRPFASHLTLCARYMKFAFISW